MVRCFTRILPSIQFFYTMGKDILDYVDLQKDLGFTINRTLNFTGHAEILYSKANQRLGLLKRSRLFINDQNKRRVLYLTMVRSVFEHCPTIWRPSPTVKKLESIQKRAVKWIKQDFSVSYTYNEFLYYTHCKQLRIQPLKFRFDFHDL